MLVANDFRRLCSISGVFLILSLMCVFGQDESISEIRYKEDYDQIQKIIKIVEPVKRADQMLLFYKGRSDMDPKLREYADNIFARDLETLMKQRNYVALKGLSERAIKLRPRFGEAYFFYAVALKFDDKVNEAMDAFAKCYLIANPLQKKAKELLDTTYRSISGGSLAGEEKIINNAKRELK